MSVDGYMTRKQAVRKQGLLLELLGKMSQRISYVLSVVSARTSSLKNKDGLTDDTGI